MNCTDAKKISLVSILEKIGAKKIKEMDREIWYLSPFRNEKTASFKIDIVKNVFYDHGNGKGGNILDFIMEYYTCDLKDALQILGQNSFSFHQQPIKKIACEKENQTQNIEISELKNEILLSYIEKRKLNIDIVKKYCLEIKYENNLKKYFGICFRNESNGYEIRNKYFKGCVGKKDISIIKKDASKVILFEGWIDFLSLLSLYPDIECKFDFIILNSISLKQKVSIHLAKYKFIYLCFDNDSAGDLTTSFFKNSRNYKTKDIRFYFGKFKDLNDFLMNKD